MQADHLDLHGRIFIPRSGKRRRIAWHGRHRRLVASLGSGAEVQLSLWRGRPGRVWRQREVASGATRGHEARRELQDQRPIVRAGQLLECALHVLSGLSGGKSGAFAGPHNCLAQGRVQRVDLGEDPAAAGWQLLERAFAVDIGPRGQGVGQQAGDTEGRQQANSRLGAGTRLQAGTLGFHDDDPLVDRLARAHGRIGAPMQERGDRESSAQHRRSGKNPAQASATGRHAAVLARPTARERVPVGWSRLRASRRTEPAGSS